MEIVIVLLMGVTTYLALTLYKTTERVEKLEYHLSALFGAVKTLSEGGKIDFIVEDECTEE